MRRGVATEIFRPEKHDEAVQSHAWRLMVRLALERPENHAERGSGSLRHCGDRWGHQRRGLARDAAGRGLSVFLAEQHDLAPHTSSASTKLIHGGLRYLEALDFRLVREALLERERLLESAAHIVKPLRFILPHEPSVRPASLIRLGLLLYDTLAPRRHLPSSRTVNLKKDAIGNELKGSFEMAFAYSDCWVDDSRLTALSRSRRQRNAERTF